MTTLEITAERGRDLVCVTVARSHPNAFAAWAKVANAIDKILGCGTWTVISGDVYREQDKPLRDYSWRHHSWPARCDRW